MAKTRPIDRLRLGTPLIVGGRTLVPIERIRVEHAVTRHGGWLSASKEVVAVLVRDEAGARILDLDGRRSDADTWCDSVEGLAEWLTDVDGDQRCLRSTPEA